MKNILSKNFNRGSSSFLVVLGIAQDGGVPHCGCNKSCCRNGWEKLSARKNVTSIAIIDPKEKQRWLIDITPDFKFQLAFLDRVFPVDSRPPGLNGIFITHGHIGHFSGLLFLEKAQLNSQNVPVFVMPRMKKFLLGNRPWKEIIERKNIQLQRMRDTEEIALNSRLFLTPFLVPHRTDYTETIGFWIKGPRKKVLFIPDIDKWEPLPGGIEEKICQSDMALLDGTFFSSNELPHRNISQVPHPFVVDSVKRFSRLPLKEISKINFIHINHTNPILIDSSEKRRWLENNGFRVAQEGKRILI